MTIGKLIAAIALNLFVMPGSGHVLFKRKLRGTIFMVIVSLIAVVFVVHLSSALHSQLMVVQTTNMDLTQLMKFSTALSQDILVKNMLMIRVYVFLLGVCYIAGTADLFWLYYETKDNE